MICKICISYMLDHPERKNWKKCPSCGFSCEQEVKDLPKLDKEKKTKYPSSLIKKILGIKE